MKIHFALLLFLSLSLYAQTPYPETVIYQTKFDDAIPVLNVATFHMGETSDANTTEFDENDRENQREIKRIASLLAEF